MGNIDELFIEELNKKENDEFAVVFQVRLKDNQLIPHRTSEFIESKYEAQIGSVMDYRQTMLAYVLEYVDKGEQEKLIQSLLPERLTSLMYNQPEFISDYREEIDGRCDCNRIVIKRIGSSPIDVFIGIITNVEESRREEIYHLGGRKVLVVEQENDALSGILTEKFDVIQAKNVEQAVDILSKEYTSIVAVITGSKVDDTSIKELLGKIITDSYYSAIPVVVTMDKEYKGQGKEAEYLKLGAFDFISSPYNVDVIVNRINGAVSFRETTSLVSMMERDSVTGLYAREFFKRYANNILKENPSETYDYVCIDIENYQMHLEKYGSVVADLIVNHVVSRIQNLFSDIVLAGRIAEDQIALIRKGTPFEVNSKFLEEIRVGAPVPNLVVKIGIAKSESGKSIKSLNNYAQTAISKISQQYGEYFAEYSDKMRLEEKKEQSILSSMEAALEQNQFEIYYQPKHSTVTGEICGAEALVRWIHPEYGFMNPGDFIPLFERVGFIRGLDRYMCARVCADLARWKAMGRPQIPVSVNLSRRDFETGDLDGWILNLIKNIGIAPELLHIEVTESAFTDNPELITACIKKLHDNGIVIELDDFGVGYSSLNMLNSMELDILKIDKSIVQQDTPGHERNILEFCIGMAKLLGLNTVAEGVETEEQRKRMQELQCDYIQGYYYSKPLAVDEFEKYVVSNI